MFATTVYTGNGSATGRPLQVSKRWKNVRSPSLMLRGRGRGMGLTSLLSSLYFCGLCAEKTPTVRKSQPENKYTPTIAH